jgi:hypothetical protein
MARERLARNLKTAIARLCVEITSTYGQKPDLLAAVYRVPVCVQTSAFRARTLPSTTCYL